MAVSKLVGDRGAEWEEGNTRLYSKRKERENVREGNVKRETRGDVTDS